MSLKKLRKNLSKATAVGAVVGIATCLFPAIAQAQVKRIFGSFGYLIAPIGEDEDNPSTPPLSQEDLFLPYFVQTSDVRVRTKLNTLVKDINSLDSVGEFPGAIEYLM